MKPIPDFDAERAQVIEYILSSDLAKKAMMNPPFGDYTNILIAIIEHIDRLADNCHMPEFTNHALPHVCSIVKRASEWAVSDGWIEDISEKEAAYLLVALLIHDIGMLSQDTKEIPDDKKNVYLKGLSNVADWVRRTHVIRIDKLVKQLLQNPYIKRQGDENLISHLNVIIGMAASHSKWPWEANFVSNKEDIIKQGLSEERIAAFNAVIAVCDLLDEDSNRCDTITLIKHRQGTIENMAHWIRHSLTKEVIGVCNHTVDVHFRLLKPECDNLEMVYRTLRNHYRLVKLYNEKLTAIHAEIKAICFYPADGCPEYEDYVSDGLNIYKDIKEFEYDLVPYLIKTFMSEAKNDDGGDKLLRKRLNEIGLENIDLSSMDEFVTPNTLLYPEERVIFGEATVEQRLMYIKEKADTAYLDGEIGKLRHLCMEALEIVGDNQISLNQMYWAITYLIVYELFDSDHYLVTHKYKNSLLHFQDGDKITSDGPYGGLVDVLLMYVEPELSSEQLLKYKEHILAVDYERLVEDEATSLLLQSVVGLFWFWRCYGENIWFELSKALEEKIVSQQLRETLTKQREQLKLQEKILFHTDEVKQTELDTSENSVLAKAWTCFYLNDVGGMRESISKIVTYADNHTDYMLAVQGYQNITRGLLFWNRLKLEGKIANSENAGIYRYQRMTAEQPLANYWSLRESKIEELLATSRMEPRENASNRMHAMRLIVFRCMESMANWNLGEYIESVRNFAQWSHSCSTYKDKYGTYQGTAAFLPTTVICGIQGIDNKLFSEEERKTLFSCMRSCNPEGYHEIFRFMVENPCKIQWEHTLKWMKYIVNELTQDEISELLTWLLRYKEFMSSITHLNLTEYAFLEPVVERFREEDWPLALKLLENIYINGHVYVTNKSFGKEMLLYMPEDMCKNMIAHMAKWPSDMKKLKTDNIYEVVVLLSNKRPELKGYLTQIVEQLNEREENPIYSELLILIPADNVLQRTTIEWENIVKILDCTLESFTQDEELSAKSYSSCKTQEVLGAFLNQNWNLVAEEQVMQLIHKLKDFLIEYEEKLNPLYFYEFSYLFRSLVNTGTEKERMEIGNIYAHSFLRVDLQQEQNTKDDYIDGPFQTVHLDFGEMGRRDAAIFMVLLNCISFLDQESAELFRQWVKRLFSNDRGSKFFGDCVLTFVYYYFNGDADVSADSFAWLMYILGVLEASSNEEYLKKTVQALRNLRNLSHWTQPKNIQDLDKRKVLYEEQFVRPIYKVAKESYDIEVMKWINETEVTKNRGE